MLNTKTIVLVGLASLPGLLTGCRPKQATNQEMLAAYGGEKYQEDIVASDYEATENQGDSIDPRTQASIQDAIETVWVTDFETCLELEMDRLGNRWIGGDFAVEFMLDVVRQIVEEWPQPPEPIAGRSLGASPQATVTPVAERLRTTSAISRDLPRPASAAIPTTRPAPPSTSSSACSNTAISESRPTIGSGYLISLFASPRRSPTMLRTRTGSALPLTARSPTS